VSNSAPTPKAPLLRLLRYARGYRRRVWAASTCSVINKLFDIAPEILIGIAIDVVVRAEKSFLADFGLVDPSHQIFALGGLTLLIWAGESLFEYLYLLLWRGLAQDLQHDLRVDGFAHLTHLDLAYFEDQRGGNLVAILNDDINQLERFLNGGANTLIQVATTLVAVGSVFFAISPLIALLAFTPIPVIVWGAFFFQRRAQPLYAEVRERAGQLAARLANAIGGIATIKSYTRETLELKHLSEESRAYCTANSRAIRISSAFIPLIRMAILAGFMATLIVGGLKTLDGELNVGLYGVLVFLTQRLLWPLTGLAETVDLYERAMASTRRVLGLLDTQRSIPRDGKKRPARLRGEVAMHGVDFAYADGRPVLMDVDLRVDPGQTLALVGSTGSGKSSLIKLLLRFYAPSDGRILVDGEPIENYDLHWLRSNIGLVSQDVFLFDGSVEDNIAYGRPDASPEQIRRAARLSEAHGFITELPDGYQTQVGERGQKLSGGQRQRLSLARAVLKDPPILLLDEATSAVDNETEAAIQRSLAQICVGRTTIMIAHRLSTVVHADQILVVEGGRVVERGQHQELVAANGVYAALWAVQTGLGVDRSNQTA